MNRKTMRICQLAAAATVGILATGSQTFANIRSLAPGEEIVYQTVQSGTNYRSSFGQITGNAYTAAGDEILLGGSNRYVTNIAMGTQTYFNPNTPGYMDGVNSQPPEAGFEDTGGWLEMSIYLNDGPIDIAGDPFVDAAPNDKPAPNTLLAKVRVPTPTYPTGGVSRSANGVNDPDNAADNANDPWIVEFPMTNLLLPNQFTFALSNLNAAGATDGHNFDANAFGLWYGTLSTSNTDPDSNPATFNNDTAYNTNLVGQSRTGPFSSLVNNGQWDWVNYNGPRVSPTPWESDRDTNHGPEATMYALGTLQSATVYWDTDGFNTAGAGGATPSGSWDGLAVNFNSNSAGTGPGMLKGKTTAGDTVVFSAGNTATGSYTVTVSGTQSATAVNIPQGNVTLTGGTLAVGAFDVSAGATGTVTSTIAAPSSSMTKSGLGMLSVSKLPQSHAVSITGGTLRVLESAPTFPNHPAGDDAQVSRPSSLSISAGATLDLTNNDLILPYTGTSPAGDIEDLIAQGFNGGDWLGTGITSSAAASDDAAGNFVLAIVDNANLPQPYGVSNGGDNFDGVDVPLESVLVKFTHRVDLNLDGLVTDADAIIFSTNYESGAAANWGIGDLDYDGTFTDNDAIIFGTFYDTGLAHLPEPSTVMISGIAVMLMAARRSR
jgi:hypothetical protein